MLVILVFAHDGPDIILFFCLPQEEWIVIFKSKVVDSKVHLIVQHFFLKT